ncbi:MAG: hypothetical protein QXT77_05445 [Candidatus Methanomethylicaceae archaeon]
MYITKRVMRLLVLGIALSVTLLASFATSAYTVSLTASHQLAAATPNQAGFQELPKQYGCKAQTHSPHKSTHVPTNVNVIGMSWCKIPMPEIGVNITLYKGRLCIPFTTICLFWDPWGSPGEDIKFNAREARANAAGQCETGVYQGVSFHWVIAPHDGQLYYTITWKKARVRC